MRQIFGRGRFLAPDCSAGSNQMRHLRPAPRGPTMKKLAREGGADEAFFLSLPLSRGINKTHENCAAGRTRTKSFKGKTTTGGGGEAPGGTEKVEGFLET